MGSLSVNVGGAWRGAVPSVNVGGAWHAVTGVFVNVGGSWHQVYSSAGGTYNFTLNAGENNLATTFGYNNTVPFGSITPSANLPSTSPALDIRTLTYNSNTGVVSLSVEGFGADPGSGWLQSLTISSHAFPAASYSYSGGIATWSWSSPPVTIGLSSYTCALVHS